MIMSIKQQIINISGNIKQINIKNRTYYFFNDMINIKGFDTSLLNIDKKSHRYIGIYNIGYITITKIDDYENIYSVNPLYLMIGKVIGHIEENNGNKYLTFDSMELHSADESKEISKNAQNFRMGLKIKLRS